MAKEATTSEPVRRRPGILHSTFGHIIIGVLAALIVGICAWGYATMSANRDTSAVRDQLAAAQRDGAIREAQVRLYEAAGELERRNFGTANDLVKQAGSKLATLPPRADGSQDPRASRIQQGIGAIDLTAASADVGAQREQILQLAGDTGGLASGG